MDSSEHPMLDHQGLEVLTSDECWQLIRNSPVGRVSFVESGDPMILPINHGVAGHTIAFRTARGALLYGALLTRPVAFEVDDYDVESRTGWSVLVRGQARLPEDTEELDALGLHAWADAVERDEWVAILPEEVTGRRIVRHDAGE